MKRLREYRNTLRGFSDELIWHAEPVDGVIKNKDGSLMAAWYFRGEDLGSATKEELRMLSARLNQAFCLLGGGWMLHCDAVRRALVGYSPKGAFTDRTSYVIDEERRQIYNEADKHYETIHVLTLTFLPDIIHIQKFVDFLYENNVEEKGKSRESRILENFNRQCEDFENVLTTVFPISVRRLKTYTDIDSLGDEYTYDEFLEYLEFCISGYKRPVKLPSCPMDIDALIGNYEVHNGSEIILDGRLIKIIAIDGFPQDSYPAILHALDQLSFEYRWSTRFQLLEPYEARQMMEKERRAWRQKIRGLTDQMFRTSKGSVNLDAAEMAQDVELASSEAESGLVRYGFYTSVLVLGGENFAHVRELALEVCKVIRNTGYGARIETINTMGAFIGSLPGHGYENVRKATIHTLNLAHMLPTTSVWVGLEYNPNPLYPHKSPPLMLTSTTGSTVFRFSPHVSDVGHSLLLGPTGAGKTTMINLWIAQHFRYPKARVFGFDRKYGSFVLTKASGGSYYDLGSGKDSAGLRLCPLGDLETPEDIVWANDFIETLLSLQNFATTAEQRNIIHGTILRFATKEKGVRSLTEFAAELQDKKMREALLYYTLDGSAGYILDGANDTLQYSDFMMFEMESISEMSDKILIPTLLYLFRQMEKRLDGSPTFVPIDESWVVLMHDLFKNRIEQWLRTWRSKNAYILLASQQPSDIIKSSIADAMLASCPTKILLANREATGTARKMYEMLDCNEKEIDLIASAVPKKDYYYKSPLGRRMFSLDLGPVSLSFVGASSKEDIKIAAEYIDKYKERWPAEWLRSRGLPDWADYWLKVSH